MKRALFGIAFFLSIALNVTMLAEKLSTNEASVTYAKNSVRGNVVAIIAKQLPDSMRKEMQDELKEMRQTLRKVMEEVKAERQQVFEYMMSDQYTHEEASKKLALLREKTTNLQQISQEMILNIADKLTPAKRKELLFQLKDKMKKF